MSSYLHSGSELRVLIDEWRELCETIRDTAEGFAATDPSGAWLYRSEAMDFCAQPAPFEQQALTQLESDASLLRQRWSARFREKRGE